MKEFFTSYLFYAFCCLPFVFTKLQKHYPDKSGGFHIAWAVVICLAICVAFYGLEIIFSIVKD